MYSIRRKLSHVESENYRKLLHSKNDDSLGPIHVFKNHLVCLESERALRTPN